MKSYSELIREFIKEKIDFDKLEKLLYDIVDERVDKSINVENGILKPTETTQSIVKKSIKDLYESKAYQSSLLNIMANIELIGENRLSELSNQGFKVNVSDALKLSLNEHISYLNEQGLNDKFNQPLRKLIWSNINQGKSMRELRQSLKLSIESGENPSELSRYVSNISMQAADSYTSTVDQEIVNKYKTKIKGFEMTGSLIATSSPQCKYAVELGRRLSLKEWDKVIEIANENGAGIEDVYNLPSIKLHFGCRHTFTPILTTI